MINTRSNLISMSILALIFLVFLSGCVDQSTEPTTTTTTTTTTQPATTTQITTTTTKQTETYNVGIKNFAFSPSEIRVKKGDTVIWTNGDSTSHTVTSDSGSELNSDFLSQGETYSHTFNEAGTFSYHCRPHTFMNGKVIVEE